MIHTIYMPEDKGKSYTEIVYPAGEVQIRFTEEQANAVEQADAVRLIARCDIMRIGLMADCLYHVMAGQQPVTLVLPYLNYSRADRRFTTSDCFGLHVYAKMLNAITFDKVITVDAHSSVAKRHINNFTNISVDALIKNAIDYFKQTLTVLLPDEGSLGRYHFPPGTIVKHCTKKRDAKTGTLSGFDVPHIHTDHALIVDDICDGGGTFRGIAKKAKEMCFGRNELSLFVTHGIFSKGLDIILDDFEHVFTTNTIQRDWLSPHLTEYSFESLLEG